MTPRFDDYMGKIRALPADPGESDVIDKRFLLAREGRVEVFYAPLHGYTRGARVIILGLTPGISQMVQAFREARQLLYEGWEGQALFGEIRRRMAFLGTMRANLIAMLDEIGVARQLDLETTADLFAEASDQLHSTSLLRYPVLRDRRNYSGSPRVASSSLLREMARANLQPELDRLPDALVVPLGRAVETALVYLGLDANRRVLRGFPHPSGGNGHRVAQFKSEHGQLRAAVRRML